MPNITAVSSGVVLKNPLRLFLILGTNRTGSAGTFEIINDITNNAANHIVTIPCPVADIRGFNVPEGMMFLSIGLWLNITSMTEVLVVYG